MEEKAYLYGVLLGDGFYGKWAGQKKDGFGYVMLKTIDREFAERFQKTIEALTGKKYSVYGLKPPKKRSRQRLWLCKCYAPEIVEESIRLTHNKTEIPNFVLDGEKKIKLAFLQGIMDSEGYLALHLSPIKAWNCGLHFASTAAYTKDVWHLFRSIGIEVSKLHRRKMKDDRKDVLWFKIHILQYVEAGLGFTMKRKQRRLDFVSQILRDYTCDYKTAYRKACVEDIVQPVAKAMGE